MNDLLIRRVTRALALAALALLGGPLAAVLVAHGPDTTGIATRRDAYALQVSPNADRSSPRPLKGATLPDPAYAFLQAPSSDDVVQVDFYLDDPRMQRAPFRTEQTAPYDVGGGAMTGQANPWDVSALAPGSTHKLTQRTTLRSGRTVSGTASFTVPSAAASPESTTTTTAPPATTTTTAPATTTTTAPATTTTTAPPSTLGSYPTPATTGVPAGWTPSRVHDGDLTASTPGQVIDGWRITGVLTIAAPNVTVRNSEVYGQIWLASSTNAGGLLVEDTTIGPPTGVSPWPHGMLGAKGYTARRVEIRNASDGFRVSGNDVLIEDSFFKAVQPGCDHLDGVQGYYGGTNVVVRHNTLDVRGSCSTAAIFFGDSSREIQAFDNLAMGGSFVLKSNDAENVGMLQRFHGNRIVDATWDYGPTHFQYGAFDLGDNRLVTIDSAYRVTSVGPEV